VDESNDTSRPGCSTDFLQLLLACQPKLRSFIFAMVPHWHDADEIYQETSLVLWEKFTQFRPGTDFHAWACQIARNKVMNFRNRRASTERIFSDAFLETIAQERLGRTDWDERRAALAVCREKLRPRERDLLDRCYQTSATTKQVAEALGRPVDTLYKSLKRIRETLYLCVQKTLAREERT
jgi:RNA polymerase sigma-70 factor, ECF subfamily